MKLFVLLLLSCVVMHACATRITAVNKCSFGGKLEFTGSDDNIKPGQSITKGVPQGWSGRVSLDPLPSTLAEFTVAKNGHDTFDISLVDGYNVGLKIDYTGNGCIKNGAPVGSSVSCRISVDQCPGVRNNNRCTNPNKDQQTNYSKTVKRICPDAYSWSKDDRTSTYTCNPGGDYTVTFCP